MMRMPAAALNTLQLRSAAGHGSECSDNLTQIEGKNFFFIYFGRYLDSRYLHNHALGQFRAGVGQPNLVQFGSGQASHNVVQFRSKASP